jgi:hypothetical protein
MSYFDEFSNGEERIRLSTNAQNLGRLLYFYMTRNKFRSILPFEPTCCRLDCSQETAPKSRLFSAL